MKSTADYDSPWKEVLERYLPAFMAFYFPAAHGQIDWSQGYIFLDKELQQVVREATIGTRRVDKLVEVARQNGETAWALIHVEVQGQRESDFAERMYIYNYRIFDRYRRPVASLALLTDDKPRWRPDHYGYELFGCQVRLRFPVVKLMAFAPEAERLAQEPNPFAVVTLAHLHSLATRHHAGDRYAAKLNLARQLYQRGYERDDILELFRFIDWVMTLPPELETQFKEALMAYEAEVRKPYVTSVERLAIQEGLQAGLQHSLIEVLDARFGPVPASISQRIEQLTDIPTLRHLHRQAVTIPSLEAFEELLPAT